MFWAYYRSTILINLCVSAAITLIASFYGADVKIYFFAASFAFVGPSFAFLYKEVVNPFEYYFYYNRAISKIKLMSFCLSVSTLLAAIILLIVYYVT